MQTVTFTLTAYAELYVSYSKKRFQGKIKHIFRLKKVAVVPVRRSLLNSEFKICFRVEQCVLAESQCQY